MGIPNRAESVVAKRNRDKAAVAYCKLHSFWPKTLPDEYAKLK